jgi:ribosomal protein S12 methylthiotransferase
MRRPERLHTLRDKLAWLRGAIPDLAIRTTCLVGFPGETEEDFRTLVGFLEEAQFDRMGGFAYSPQEGTRAMQFADDVEDGVKQDRLEEIVEVQRAISAERLERFVGREVDVLMDDPKVGRVKWQADDVDGVTHLERGQAEPGGFVRARITASEDYDFQAAALT